MAAIEGTSKPDRNKHNLYTKISELISETKLRDIMSDEVISIREDAPFSDVPKKMRIYSIRHIPVVDGQNKVVGLITQRMMYKIKSPRKLMDGEWYYDEEMLNNVILKNVMTKEVYTLHPDLTMGKALMKMAYGKFGCIPITEHNETLIGIVTRRDLLKIIADIYKEGGEIDK